MAGLPTPANPSDPEGKIVCVADLEAVGSRRLPKMIREFYNSGSTDEQTIRENLSAFNKYRLRSRVLVDVSQCTTKASLWGNSCALPLGIAPAGAQGLAHPDGELATARASAKRNVPMGISSFANFSLEDIRKEGLAHNDQFTNAMQMYTMSDRPLMERLLKRAENAGCTAIFLTADSPVLGVRYNEWRNDFRFPPEIQLPNIEYSGAKWREETHDQNFTRFKDDGHSWERDIPWLRRRSKMQIYVKGILTREDTRKAIEAGCDGIIVSNHGGRQLDGVPATIDALIECVDEAKGTDLKVHVDGGFRRGSDIFIALALGAAFVWVGRPALWGLAYDGEKGVDRMLELIHEDFRRCMALCGCNRVKDIKSSCISRLTADGLLARL